MASRLSVRASICINKVLPKAENAVKAVDEIPVVSETSRERIRWEIQDLYDEIEEALKKSGISTPNNNSADKASRTSRDSNELDDKKLQQLRKLVIESIQNNEVDRFKRWILVLTKKYSKEDFREIINSTQDSDGRNLLMLALYKGRNEIIGIILRETICEINQICMVNGEEKTALDCAPTVREKGKLKSMAA